MDEGSILAALVLIWVIIPGAIGLLAVFGVVNAGVQRGRPRLIPVPLLLIGAALLIAANGPIPTVLRWLAVVGIPGGIALILFLPARADSAYARGDGRGRTLALSLYALTVAILFAVYLATDPSSCHAGGC